MGSISSNKGGFYYSGHLLQVSEKVVWTLILYRFSHDFIHAGAGAVNSNGVNLEHHRKLLSLWTFAVKFQKDCFELQFYKDFFMTLYMYIAPLKGK